MARAILALPTIFEYHNGLSHSGTAIYASARMARAILALKSCIRLCQNGSGHSGTQVMQLAVPEWIEPFWHSNHASGRAKMARAILELKLCNWPCQNGSNHSYTQVMQLAVSEWFESFWHGQLHNLSARMARAILARPDA